MALELRDISTEYFKETLLPAVEIHRSGQYHHHPINEIPIFRRRDHRKVNLVDTLCCLMEDRPYWGGERDYDGLREFIADIKEPRRRRLERILDGMQSFPRPALSEIVSPVTFPNIGLPEWTYNETRRLVAEAINSLKQEHQYDGIE